MATRARASFGELLRQCRRAAGLTQQELAERAGLSARGIADLERGARRAPRRDTLQRLTDALQLAEADRAALVSASRQVGLRGHENVDPPRERPASRLPNPVVSFVRRPRGQDTLLSAMRETAFVGRELELTLLAGHLQEASAGRGGVVMLSGEPGIGKTRLAERFAAHAEPAGARVLWGRCFESEGSPPYGPWAEALRGYACKVGAERLYGRVGITAAPLARLVPSLGALLPETARGTVLSQDEERFRLQDAVVQLLLGIAADRPLVVVLDDLHWADRDSLLMLRHVGRFVRQSRVLVLGTYRDVEIDRQHPLGETLAMLRREVDYARISVGAWSLDETAAYLDDVFGSLGNQSFPGAIARRIFGEAQGSPFYTRELVRHLVDEGTLIQRDGRWWTDQNLREIGIPEGIRQVISRRLARLSEETNTVLRCAAGCTGGFAFSLLPGLTHLPEPTVLDCIDEALAAGLIHVLPGSGEIYDFSHALVRHTLYEELSPSRRARLHRRIAEVLEAIGPTGGDSSDAEVAAQYHASRSLPGAERGIAYALRAAERARAAYAPQRAVALLRVARDLADTGAQRQRVEVLERLAIAEAEAMLLEDVPRTSNAALDALAAESAGRSRIVEFLERLARALKEGGAPHAIWEPLVDRGLALLADVRDLWWARLALLQDRYVELSRGLIHADRWLGHDAVAIQLARTLGDEDDYARSLDPLAWREPAETDDALAHARSWSRPTAILRGLDAVARDLAYRHGAFAAAAERYRELYDAAQGYGSIPLQAEALAQLAVSLMGLGEFAAAIAALAQAREHVARLGPDHRLHFLVTVGAPTGLAYYMGGDWSSVVEHGKRHLSRSASLRTPLGLMAPACLALAQWRLGNTTAARQLLDGLAAVLTHVEPRFYMHNYVVVITSLLAWEMQVRELAPLLARLARELIDSRVGPSCMGTHELSAARMAALLGDQPHVEGWFARARVVAAQHGMRGAVPLTDFDQAMFLLVRPGRGRDSERAQTLLHQAAREFSASGMTYWADRAHVVLSGRRTARALDGLTPREIEVLQLIASGHTSKEIAGQLVLSVGTVQRHVANIYTKIDARGRADAAAYALRHGLVTLASEPPT